MKHEPRWPAGVPTRLRPVEPIAVSAAATVWRVVDTASGTDLVVKVTTSGDDAEVRSLARLADVDGVADIVGVGALRRGGMWICTPWMPGGSLYERARNDAVGQVELLRWGSRLAHALDRVHRLDIVHGDIAPTNVLFESEDLPVLADFGAAALDGPARPGGFTPAVAAPERLLGEPASWASDVHALAATLHWASRAHGDAEPPVLPESVELAMSHEPRLRPDAASLARAFDAALASLG